jgi:AcrR family transcriptional regulator
MDTTTYTKTIDTCWTLAEQGLDKMTVASIANQSGISETELNSLFPEQKYILLALLADIKSKTTLAEYSEALSNDDQFFDAVMSYYDTCQPHKSAIKKLSEDLLWSPLLSLSITPSMQQLSNELADRYYPLPENSIKASCQNAGLKLAIQILLLRVFYKWLEDESFDLGATMASLDQGMKQINKLKEYF